MKTRLFTIVVAGLLVLVTMDMFGQEPVFKNKQEEFRYYCTQEERLSKECQDLKKQAEAEKQLENKIASGVEKMKKEILNSDSDIGQAARKSQIFLSPDATIEMLAQALGLEIGKDLVIENKGLNQEVRLVSGQAYHTYAGVVSDALKYFNDNLDKFKKTYKECDSLLEKNKIEEYDVKNREYASQKQELNKSLDAAKDYLNTMYKSSNDEDFRNALNRLSNQVASAREQLYKDPNKTQMLKDIEALKEYLKDCNDCNN